MDWEKVLAKYEMSIKFILTLFSSNQSNHAQVQHIFSDKTGTLTENKMIFRKCTINGVDYNHASNETDQAFSNPNSPAPPIIVNPKLMEDMCQTWNGQTYTQQAQRIQEFFLVLSICNTVVVSATPHRDMMNASGIVEPLDSGEPGSVRMVKPTESNGQPHTNSNNLSVIGGEFLIWLSDLHRHL